MNPTALDNYEVSLEKEIAQLKDVKKSKDESNTVYDQLASLATTYAPRGPQLSLSDEEAIMVVGDLERLSPQARLEYYTYRCERLGLDPFGHPFDYIRTATDRTKTAYKTVLYANKNCASQLIKKHLVSTKILREATEQGIFIVTVEASMPIVSQEGHIVGKRSAENIGAVEVAGKGGTDLANARKKAVTQGTNRAIFTLCGISELDETETTQIKGAHHAVTPEEVERGLKDLEKRLLPSWTSSLKSSGNAVTKPEESNANQPKGD